MGYVGCASFKVEKILDKTPNIHKLYVIALISCISGLMFGIDISSMSLFIGDRQYARYFHDPSTTMQSFIISSVSLGSFFGALASSFVSEHFGRRGSLLLCGFFWSVGAAIL